MKNLLITGPRGVGKTTLANRIFAELSGEKGGIITYYMRQGDINRIFLRGLCEEKGRHLATIRTERRQILEFYAEVFEEYGAQLLMDCAACDNVLIDEIGFLEREAKRYQRALEALLLAPPFVVAVLRDKPGEPFLASLLARKDVHTVRLSKNCRGRDLDIQALLQLCGGPE